MPVLLVALLALLAVVFGIFWLQRANPSKLARGARLVLAIIGTVGLGGLLVIGLRFVPGMLPELLGAAGVVIATLIARAARRASTGGGGFGAPGPGRRTGVRTSYLDAWIDHESGEVGGAVLMGRFRGRTLDALSDIELRNLHLECAGDGDSIKVLEAYLDRRLGADWRVGNSASRAGGDMSREEALGVLGLTESANDEAVRAAHRRLIQRVHPDVGGSADLAARINRAKEVLLDRSKR